MNISRERLEELARRCGRKPNGEIVTSGSERQTDDYEVGQMARELLKLLPGNRGLTMRQAAARLGVSEAAVHNWVYQQRWIPVVRIGERCVRIPCDKLEEFIKRHTIPSKEEDPDWWADFLKYRIKRRPQLRISR
jgi:excisionase family DNA binding protein